MGRSQRSKVEIHGTLYLSPEGADWPHPWWPGGPVGGGEPGPGVAPTLTSLDPATAELNSADVTMHCHGTGFTPESVIVFAGQDEPIEFISENEITTGITLSLPWGAVTVPVSVRNADGQQTADLDFTFTEAAAAGPATLTSLEPTSALIDGYPIPLTCNGSGFTPESVISFNGSFAETTFVSANQLTMPLNPSSTVAVPGPVPVSVVALDETETDPLTFTWLAPPPLQEDQEATKTPRKRR